MSREGYEYHIQNVIEYCQLVIDNGGDYVTE